AIIDTGSQLNVMTERKMHEYLPGYVIDTSGAMRMTDASGRQTPVVGIVRDVEIAVGSLSSLIDVYIIDSRPEPNKPEPYELLLGRPWQRGNQISIEERSSGTRLLVPNP
ncbi:uncharacterized protein SCHCODRAFT_02461172, partial [Schizophyllum commune H4-8]|uniref:uncharacterized protein n=1 Tax=Schizophyllum commune (strain H4-8 / FGSC 9210) TaxID=578458 RepID=UPI00215DED2C